MLSERLPRLPKGEGLWTDSGKPTPRMQRLWEMMCENIEAGRSRMDDILTQTIYADHTGAALAGQLPKTLTAKRYFNEVDVTASSTWSIAVRSGSATVSIGAATGAITISAVGAAASVVRVTSVRNALTIYKDFTIIRSNANPPSSGSGGGTSASDSTFASFNSATHAAVSDELTVTTGTAGEVALSAPLNVTTAAAAPDGTYEVFGKWEWYNGAAWVDVAAEVASNPDTLVIYESESNIYVTNAGSISVAATKTGLGASTSQKFRLMARNASGTRTMTFSGTASAVAS